MTRQPPASIIAIDLLRFGCALLVVSFHIDMADWMTPSPHAAQILPHHLIPDAGTIVSRVGWIGVELFFVISGLVIAQSAVDTRWQDFLRRRVLRLAPAAWACATLTLVMLATTGRVGAPLVVEWLRSVMFWPIGPQIDMSYWTLGVETFFYLMVAATLGASGSLQKVERLGWAIGLVSGGTWFAALCWPQMVGQIVANQAATLLLVPFGIFFSIGILIAAAKARPMGLASGCFAIFLGMAAMIEIDLHANGRAAASGLATSSPMAIAIFFSGVALLFAAPALQRPLSRWISPGTARAIGLMTYPLYLIHQDAGAVVLARLLEDGVPFRMAQALTVVLMLAIAFWITRLPEPWLRERLNAVMRPRGPLPDNRPIAFPANG